MVRAILEGRKTQTRRVVKPQPPEWVNNFGYTCFTPQGCISGRGHYREEGLAEKFFKCPYGLKGDRLWVRESFFIPDAPYAKKERDLVHYKADETSQLSLKYTGWRSSLFMPRWASRLTLEIANVRVERVQEISEADARAEGGFLTKCPCLPPARSPIESCFSQTWCHQHGHSFKSLWDHINGKRYPWASNPWVWVVEFRRIEQERKAA